MRCTSLSLGRFFGVLFVLHEFDVGDLRARRRRNQEEESENESGEEQADMEDVRARCGLGHLQGRVAIESATLYASGVIISVARRKRRISDEKYDDENRSGRAEMQSGKRTVEFVVQLHAVRLTESGERIQYLIGEHEEDENNIVEDANYHEEQAFALFTVVNLPQTRKDERQPPRHVRVALRSLRAGMSVIGSHKL